MIKYLILSIVIYTALISGLTYAFFDKNLSIGVLFGGLTVLTSIGGLASHWYLIIHKKLIALALLIIIFKYLILIALLWSVYSFKWIDPIGFCLGLTALIFSLFVALVIKRFSKNVSW